MLPCSWSTFVDAYLALGFVQGASMDGRAFTADPSTQQRVLFGSASTGIRLNRIQRQFLCSSFHWAGPNPFY